MDEKAPLVYCNYHSILVDHLLAHKNFNGLPRDLQFRIRNNQKINASLTTTELIAVENYLNHLYPLGYRLEDSVDTMIQEELGSERPFIIHSG